MTNLEVFFSFMIVVGLSGIFWIIRHDKKRLKKEE